MKKRVEEIDRPSSTESLKLRDWSDLPKDILTLILECLNSGVYHVLLRSVCPAWRSSLSFRPLPNASVSEKIFFHVSPFEHAINSTKPNWIIQVEQVSPNKWSFSHPMTGEKLCLPRGDGAKSMNLLDYRIIEIWRSFPLKSADIFTKVIRSSSDLKSPVLMALPQHDGKLAFINQPGFQDFDMAFKDIIYYNGRFYAVDAEGILVMINPSNWRKPTIFIVRNPIIKVGDSSNRNMYLIVSQGSFYLVDVRYVTKELIEVYKLREEGGQSEWVRVTSIGEEVFFICKEASFALSSAFVGSSDCGNHIFLGKSACIYVLDSDNGEAVPVGRVSPNEGLFWPPPKWVLPDGQDCALTESCHLFGFKIPRKIWLDLANGLTVDDV